MVAPGLGHRGTSEFRTRALRLEPQLLDEDVLRLCDKSRQSRGPDVHRLGAFSIAHKQCGVASDEHHFWKASKAWGQRTPKSRIERCYQYLLYTKAAAFVEQNERYLRRMS